MQSINKHQHTTKPKEFVFADYETSPLFKYFWNEKLAFKDARKPAASAVDTRRMYTMQHISKTDGEDDSDLDAEGDRRPDRERRRTALGRNVARSVEEETTRKKEKAAAATKKNKSNASEVSKGNAARRGIAKKKEQEERIRLKAKSIEEVQKKTARGDFATAKKTVVKSSRQKRKTHCQIGRRGIERTQRKSSAFKEKSFGRKEKVAPQQ